MKRLIAIFATVAVLFGVSAVPTQAAEPAPAVVVQPDVLAPETHSGGFKLGFVWHSYPLNNYAKGGWASMSGHRVKVRVGCGAHTTGASTAYTGLVSPRGSRSYKYCPNSQPFAHWVSAIYVD